jgi:hypothetical protein
MRFNFRRRRGLALGAGWALGLPLLLGQGCPSSQTNPNSGTIGAPVVTVQAPTLDQIITVGSPITLTYDVTSSGQTSVSAFYDQDGVADTGDEVVFISNLAAGSGKYAQLVTTGFATGEYWVGVTATNSAGTTTAYAPGQTTLAAAPLVQFISPTGPIRVAPGVHVPVIFVASTTDFTWRVFYDTDGDSNGNEITVAKGSAVGGATIQTFLDTSALINGTYHVGASVSTIAGGTALAYAPGAVTVISGAFVQVLLPTVGLVANQGALVQITVAANSPGAGQSYIRLFYDPDTTFGNGNEVTIGSIPVTTTGATWDTANVATGMYYVGATLVNGMTPPLVSYSAGPVRIDSPG